jgi:hypothetical protein
MNEKHPEGKGKTTGLGSGRPRKPYHKPEFRFEKVFETMALVCGKIDPVNFLCRNNRKNS